jgi:hypothetical protein
MLTSLLLPVLLSGVALFFTSFLSWMVLQLHKQDWIKLEKEDDIIAALKAAEVPVGNYMIPGCVDMKEMKSPEYVKKYDEGPCGILTVFGKVSMGRNLGLTFVYFLVVSFCLAYLAQLHIGPGAQFKDVFRFVATAGLMTYLAAIVQHAIWFHSRIVGHLIESVLYAVITAAIFGAMWPATLSQLHVTPPPM